MFVSFHNVCILSAFLWRAACRARFAQIWAHQSSLKELEGMRCLKCWESVWPVLAGLSPRNSWSKASGLFKQRRAHFSASGKAKKVLNFFHMLIQLGHRSLWFNGTTKLSELFCHSFVSLQALWNSPWDDQCDSCPDTVVAELMRNVSSHFLCYFGDLRGLQSAVKTCKLWVLFNKIKSFFRVRICNF